MVIMNFSWLKTLHRNRSGLAVVLVVAVVLTVVVGFFVQKPVAAAQDPRTEIQLVEVTQVQSAGQSTRSFTGVVTARVQSNLGFRVPGKITARLVDSGQTVRRGQPLMRIDRTDYEHAITTQSGNVAAAKARFLQASADEARFRDLVPSGAVSHTAYDQAKAAADSARALLSSTEAQMKLAQDDGTYSTLLADADGIVMNTLAEPGQYVTAGQVVLQLAHAGPREAAINLPESLRPAIGSIAEAALYGSDQRAPAKLRQLSSSADPATRTYEARYVLDGPAAQAPLGATVTAYLTTSEPVKVMSVPLGSIDDEGHGPGVWGLDTKTSSVWFRNVRIIRLDQEHAILSEGVRIGDHVVALGGHYLHEGQHVRIAQPEASLK
jgi:RND family efflux transporter MFP subunit